MATGRSMVPVETRGGSVAPVKATDGSGIGVSTGVSYGCGGTIAS